MAGREVLLLKWSDDFFREEFFRSDRQTGEQGQCRGAFFDVDAPIAAALEMTAERDHGGEHRVAVPAARQMADLRPGIRIKDVVSRRFDARCAQQPPVVDEIGAHPDGIAR